MLSIVIPVYNEEQRLIPSLEIIESYFSDDELAEILIVNDGSTDKTLHYIESYNSPKVRVVSYPKNKGKGYAVKQGMLEAKGSAVLLTDSDLSTPITEYQKLKEQLKKNVIAIGSRAMEKSTVKNKWHKIFLGRLGNKFIQLLLPGLQDTQCGFKLFNTTEVQQIAPLMRINGFGYDFELLFLGRRKGFTIVEVPVKWQNVEGSKVKMHHYITTLTELFFVWKNNVSGKYKPKKGA